VRNVRVFVLSDQGVLGTLRPKLQRPGGQATDFTAEIAEESQGQRWITSTTTQCAKHAIGDRYLFAKRYLSPIPSFKHFTAELTELAEGLSASPAQAGAKIAEN